MYKEIIKNLEQQLTDKELLEIKIHTMHLGVFTELYLTYKWKENN